MHVDIVNILGLTMSYSLEIPPMIGAVGGAGREKEAKEGESAPGAGRGARRRRGKRPGRARTPRSTRTTDPGGRSCRPGKFQLMRRPVPADNNRRDGPVEGTVPHGTRCER